MQIDVLSVLCAQLTRDQLAIAKFLLLNVTRVLHCFLSRVSTLTRDIDIAILPVSLSVCLSVRPSVCLSGTFRYQMKTA